MIACMKPANHDPSHHWVSSTGNVARNSNQPELDRSSELELDFLASNSAPGC